MRTGDPDWLDLTIDLTIDDHAQAASFNVRATDAYRLALSSAVPFLGAIRTAPVVLLLTHPALDALATPADYAFQRPDWPLGALHPDAPPGLGAWWKNRLAALVDLFGAQHVANSVAATFLTPWCSEAFEARLRLPSRPRMLALAASAAARDALVLILRGGDLWTEHPEIAGLPPTRRFYPRTWRTTRIDRDNLGDDAWTTVCKRIGVHAWL